LLYLSITNKQSHSTRLVFLPTCLLYWWSMFCFSCVCPVWPPIHHHLDDAFCVGALWGLMTLHFTRFTLAIYTFATGLQ